MAKGPAMAANEAAVLGRGLKVRGRVRGEGDLCIEAQVDGDVAVTGALDLRPGARVVGAVSAGSVSIAGEIAGDIECQGEVVIGASGVLKGDVTASALVLEEGGRFHGAVAADFDLPEAIA